MKSFKLGWKLTMKRILMIQTNVKESICFIAKALLIEKTMFQTLSYRLPIMLILLINVFYVFAKTLIKMK